jgi:2-dehydropantoate 2-reductase
MAQFEFAVLGAGAMGSIVGGHLARAGHSVAMLARGARAAHLERHGITVRGLAEFNTPVATVRDAASFAGADTLIVATKTPGTAQALQALAQARFGVTLSIQNGPLKNEILAQAFGRGQVLGALADTSGELLPDGAVLFTRNVNIFVGELDGGDSARARKVATDLDTAGVRAAATPEILVLEWSKFCSWVGLMALSVGTRAVTWKFLADPDSALLLVRLVREMGQLARALQIPVSDRAILPTASICAGTEAEAVAIVTAAGAQYRLNAPAHRMSSLQDIESGRPLEVNETLGYACGKARELRLELPLLENFTRLIAATDRARRDAVPTGPA